MNAQTMFSLQLVFRTVIRIRLECPLGQTSVNSRRRRDNSDRSGLIPGPQEEDHDRAKQP